MGSKIKSKKGQLALFIIIAIIIVIGALLYIFLRSKTGILGYSQINSQSYMDECMKKYSEEVIPLLEKQGGVLIPENYVTYKDVNISYTCYNKNNYQTCIMQTPMFISFETEQIKNYVEPRVENCFNSLKQEMEKRNYNADFGVTNFSVELVPGEVRLKAEKKIFLRKNEETLSYDKFESTLVDPIYNFAEITQEISNQEAKFCNFEYLGYMLLHPQWEISKISIDGQIKIYNIKEVKTGKQFTFAVKSCSMPAGM